MKQNLRMVRTDSGTWAGSFLARFEADRGRPDPQLVAVGEAALLDRGAVDDGAVSAAQVDDREPFRVAPYLGVAPRHLRVAERDVTGREAADDDRLIRHRDPPPVAQDERPDPATRV